MKKYNGHKLLRNLKAQEFNAAILVAIIAGLIIIYMMFLPADERRDLLDDTDSGQRDSNEDSIELLKEDVGRLDPSEKIDNRDIPNVFLFETTDSEDLTIINPVRVINGVFDKKPKTVSFSLDNLDNTDNVFLTFTASKRTGVLTITLNDINIYEYDINKLNVDPIKIDKKLLANDNIMEFTVSGVGWRFWETNEYQLENIKIIGEITDKSQQESNNIFSLTSTEYQNLDSAELQFIPYCGLNNNVGRLEVFVNSRSIYSAVPVCDDPVHQNIPIGLLSAGTNKVIFKTIKGSYTIEQIEIELESKETISNVYYFEVNDTTCEDIIDTIEEVRLTLDFVDDEERKRADLNVNGHLYRLDQYDMEYEKNIRDWIIEADECIENNFIKITPKDTIDIRELRVEVID